MVIPWESEPDAPRPWLVVPNKIDLPKKKEPEMPKTLYGLLVKQNDRWNVVETTESGAKTIEWQERYDELLFTATEPGDVQGFKIVTLEDNR